MVSKLPIRKNIHDLYLSKKAQEKFDGIRIKYKEPTHPVYECDACLMNLDRCLVHPLLHTCNIGKFLIKLTEKK